MRRRFPLSRTAWHMRMQARDLHTHPLCSKWSTSWTTCDSWSGFSARISCPPSRAAFRALYDGDGIGSQRGNVCSHLPFLYRAVMRSSSCSTNRLPLAARFRPMPLHDNVQHFSESSNQHNLNLFCQVPSIQLKNVPSQALKLSWSVCYTLHQSRGRDGQVDACNNNKIEEKRSKRQITLTGWYPPGL